ncbi:MAG: hypothetical protein B7Z73_08825 [Planctomycetia bacterium 21-64-5]|nr:MAG: hypothetical protein B7Z73_08825 [Planctomycetia bacterium 21-64-5]
MLVLTRKIKQQIQIGEDVVITILQVRGQTVRVGIEAPRQTRVVRGEIADLPYDQGQHTDAPAPAAGPAESESATVRVSTVARQLAERATADYRSSGRPADASRNPLGRLSPNIRPASSSASSPPCETSSW